MILSGSGHTIRGVQNTSAWDQAGTHGVWGAHTPTSASGGIGHE